jgi:hypothetical protein
MNKNRKLIKQYDVQEMSAKQLHAQIRLDFHNYPLYLRPKFELVSEYVKWFLEGTKCTTVRYRPNAIDIPSAFDLPLIECPNNENSHMQHGVDIHPVGTVRIIKIIIKPFAMLDDQDAHRDGFSTESELKEALQQLYRPLFGLIDDDQYVSIYTIHLIEHCLQ